MFNLWGSQWINWKDIFSSRTRYYTGIHYYKKIDIYELPKSTYSSLNRIVLSYKIYDLNYWCGIY